MPQVNQQVIATIIAVIVLLIIISVIVLLLTVYYANTKKRLLKEKDVLKTTFEQALLQTRVEIQEQTLTHISRELHDNVTQVLSFVKLNLALTGNLETDAKDAKIDESRKLVAQAISDLRDLSKSLSFEQISQLGLVKTIEIETERISKSGIIDVEMTTRGAAYSLGDQSELVLFRIFQEALNNALKHSHAKHLYINLEYSEQIFTLTITDDGNGFLAGESQQGGSGLKNILNRAALIGANAEINSAPGSGCTIKVTLNPLSENINAYGAYPDSSG